MRARASILVWAGLDGGARRRWTLAAIAALSIGVAVVTLTRHAWTASGADASGYVSQADLWRRGSLVVPQPLASDAPWGDREWPLAPLGYRPALTPGAIVPTYPAGLPLTLAAAQLVGGPAAAYVVVPLVAGLGIWVTFLLGRQAGGDATGAIAALLLAFCPIYLRQATQVMSDVPAAVWWTLALVLAQYGAARRALSASFGAGLAASLAIATRPNLAPLGFAIAFASVLAVNAPRRGWRLLAIGVGALPGCLFVLIAVVHTWLYGSPLRSGYGSNADLYALDNIVPNARLYAAWLLEGQTAMLLLVFGALVFRESRRDPALVDAGASPDTPPRSSAHTSQWPLWAVVLIVVACYLPYAVFEDWWYIRFLLPAFPAAFVLIARGLVFASHRLPRPVGRLALVASTVVLLVVSSARIRATHSLDLARDERRYALIADVLRDAVPAASAFIAMQHSGSVHHYLDRPIVRWELVPPDRLDASIAYLRARGYHPYILLDSWEAPRFRDRFASASPIGQLDWPPVLELRSPTPVRLFDPADRARYFAGTHIPTRLVFPLKR